MRILRNAWYVAMWAGDLGPDALVHRTIGGEPVVLYRRADGTATALIDRCSHRFAPLSAGRRCGDQLECPYHGLRFDPDGACVHNPHGSGRIPKSLHVRAYPVEERHTLLWLWLGDEPADPTRIPDLSYLDEGAPGMVSKRDWITMESDYQLVVDNLLDLSHVAYLHRGTLSNGEPPEDNVEIDEAPASLRVTRRRHDVVPGPMFDMMFRNDGAPVDTWSIMDWNAPGCLVHDAGVCPPGEGRDGGMTVIGTHIVTPSEPGRCLYHFAAVRIRDGESPADRDPALAEKLTALRRIAFDEQDRPIIEAQQRAYDLAGGNDALKPVMLSIDAAPLRARRILDALIAAEEDAVRAEAPAITLPSPAKRRAQTVEIAELAGTAS